MHVNLHVGVTTYNEYDYVTIIVLQLLLFATPSTTMADVQAGSATSAGAVLVRNAERIISEGKR